MTGNEQTFRQLFDLSADAIMLLDEHTFLYCNDATLNIFDCPSRELFCSKHPSDISPEFQPCGTPSFELANQRIAEAIANGQNRFQWVHQRISGEAFYAEVLLSPAEWDGKPALQAVVRDISDYKLMQRQLEEARDHAEQAAAAKSEFLAVMSHEIRTPIHGIIGAQELLLDSSLNDEQRDNALLVLHSARALLGTVDDVLDFSKIDAGKLELDPVIFSPQLLVHDIYELLRPKAEEKGIELKLESDLLKDFLLGDQGRIRQILLNLVGNAIKFTDQGNVTIASSFTQGDASSCLWQLDVTDTGIGMDEQQQAHVFDMFAQGDSSTTRRYGGTGLGLTISSALADLMGGCIRLSSRQGAGSTFSLTLSLDIAEKPSAVSETDNGKPERNYGKRALVVEDNPVNQKIIVKQLSRLGVEVDLADDGLLALEQYDSQCRTHDGEPYQVILMDLQMPNMNGVEATRELRTRGCKTPIAAITADVLKERKEECAEAGMDFFMTKPFELNRLVRLLDRYLL